MKFQIEQIAIAPAKTEAARKLLEELGLTEWAEDLVVAEGKVYGKAATNVARLSFNYEAGSGDALEFEVLDYRVGDNWIEGRAPVVSHLGMHCSEEELAHWRTFFRNRNIPVAQEVKTLSHTNPNIAGKRWYQYVIFDTRNILGVDLKFIVRRNEA